MVNLRQFRVTHVTTGQRTYVMIPYTGENGGTNHRSAAVAAGFSHDAYRFHQVRVELVNEGCERPLPFDVLPLTLRTRVA